MKGKNISDILTYAYIKRIKRWMECPVCHKRMLFSKKAKSWICHNCEYAITEDDFLDNFVFWFCDGCNDYLNAQPGFDRKGVSWVCTKCGFNNDTTFNNLRGQCKDCGILLMNPDATICPECKTKRLQKAKAVLDASADLCFTLADTVRPEETSTPNYAYLYDDDDEMEETEMKCANCGNTDTSSLWDEGDTIYCSICHHRTSVASGEDDVVECPYCHRMRDRKAMYCRHCNDSTWQASTPAEFEEIDGILKGYGH